MMNQSVAHPPYTAMGPPPLPPSQWMLPPNLPPSSSFWETNNIKDRLRDLQETLLLAKAMKSELEMQVGADAASESLANALSIAAQESLYVEAANSLIAKLRFELEPFRLVTDEAVPWEEKSVAARLANKVNKSKRNKQWRKRKRKHIAEMLAKEREQYDKVDHDADEWRTREIAKDIGKRRIEKMKEIAKLKAKEEKKQLESELELVLVVEKLQELRSLRIDKLKKQGHFFPEEDDKFLERVQAAVEEEERLAMVAATTDTAKEAIITAEESRRLAHNTTPTTKDDSINRGLQESQDQRNGAESTVKPSLTTNMDPGKQETEGRDYLGAYESLANLPIEFYHYYHGSNSDMGTLIEVRRIWDAYIRPGGSRIPGHWVEPPPPADEVWASYLVHK